MKHTEDDIKAIALKIIEDLNNDYYYKDRISIGFEKEQQLLWNGTVKNCWMVGIGIPDFQFNSSDGNVIIIAIDDETGKVYEYREGPGRPAPVTAELNSEGKYKLRVITDKL